MVRHSRGWNGSRVRTVSRALTMSYHPGMFMPKFCRPISYRSGSMRTWGSYHCDRYCWCIGEYELDILKLPPPSPILAQPKPRTLYQRDFIRPIVGFLYAHQPAPLQSRQHPFMYDVQMLADLSPRPCNMKTVAVCFLRAGTTRACRLAMVVTWCVSDGPGK
jgi:hypothetical protein